MVPIMSLWIPILLSAVLVFVASFLIHMMLGYHRSDFGGVPSEGEFLEAVRKFDIPTGDYCVPHPVSPKEMKNPEFQEKWKRGPVLIMTVTKAAPMGPQLLQWFLYCIFIGLFAAYVAGRALPPGATYRAVFRFAGVTAFAGYSLALIQNSIWYKKRWSTTLKNVFDGLVYGCLTAGAFGWLWPK